jgi:hypothetical protein
MRFDEVHNGCCDFAMHGLIEDVVVRAGKLLQLQRLYLFSVRAHRVDGRDRIVDPVYREGGYREPRQLGAKPVPGPVEFTRQGLAVRVDKRERIIFQPGSRSKDVSASSISGMGTNGAPEITPAR